MIHSASIRTVLVFGSGAQAEAITTKIRVNARATRTSNRIHYLNPERFDPSLRNHIDQIILPIVDRITTALGLRKRNFEISITNISAASVLDRSFLLSGFSADLPIFIGLLASACRIRIPDSVAATGHIASPEGEIRMVQHLPKKLEAAANCKKTHRIIIPALDADNSIQCLAPEAFATNRTQIKRFRQPLEITEVKDLPTAIGMIFEETSIVLAALRTGYFRRFSSNESKGSLLIKSLCGISESPFTQTLEDAFFSGTTHLITELLEAYLDFHFRRQRFPDDLAEIVAQLIASMPPITIRTKLKSPLVSQNYLERLGNFSTGTRDAPLRLEKLLRDPAGSSHIGSSENFQPKGATSSSGETDLDHLIETLSEPRLTQTVDHTIDNARATFTLTSAQVADQEAFYEIITPFFIHLARTDHQLHTLPSNSIALAQAIECVEKAFPKRGLSKAIAIATTGVSGGIRQ